MAKGVADFQALKDKVHELLALARGLSETLQPKRCEDQPPSTIQSDWLELEQKIIDLSSNLERMIGRYFTYSPQLQLFDVPSKELGRPARTTRSSKTQSLLKTHTNLQHGQTSPSIIALSQGRNAFEKRTLRSENATSRRPREGNIQGSSETTAATTDTLGGVKKACDVSFSLTVDQMGDDLVKNIAKLTTEENFAGRIVIRDWPDIDWAEFMKTISVPRDHEFAAMQYQRPSKNGVLHLSGGSAAVRFPDLGNNMDKPSQSETQAGLRSLFEQPQEKPVPYYVGQSLLPKSCTSFSWLDSLLHPGSQLLQASLMPGVNESQWLAGWRWSGTPIHHEDDNLRSINVVAKGWKLWVLVSTKHTLKFEKLVNRVFPQGTTASDDQFVRHKCFVISPERLENEGIDHRIEVVGPGEMIVTEPKQYHWVVNLTDCLAFAINFLLPNEDFPSTNLLLCPDCGLYPLHTEYPGIRTVAVRSNPKARRSRSTLTLPNHGPNESALSSKRRKIIHSPINKIVSKPHKASSRPGIKLTDNMSSFAWQEHLKREDRTCQPFADRRIVEINPIVLRIALAVKSRSAADILFEVVAAWRARKPTTRTLLAGIQTLAGDERNHTTLGPKLHMLISRLQSVVKLDAILIAMGQIKFSRLVGFHIAKERLSQADWVEVRGLLGLPPSGQDNRQLSEWRAQGVKLGRFEDSMLLLIPGKRRKPYDVSHADLKELDMADVEVLSRLLEEDGRHKLLLGVGRDVITSMFSGSDIPLYRWEEHIDSIMANTPEAQFRELLEPVPQIWSCMYDNGRFCGAPAPRNWPENWPVDPTKYLGRGRWCDFCDELDCHCELLLAPAAPAQVARDINHLGCKDGKQM